MLITYQNGHLDIMNAQNSIHNVSDLFLKPLNISKQVHDICMYNQKAYLNFLEKYFQSQDLQNTKKK